MGLVGLLWDWGVLYGWRGSYGAGGGPHGFEEISVGLRGLPWGWGVCYGVGLAPSLITQPFPAGTAPPRALYANEPSRRHQSDGSVGGASPGPAGTTPPARPYANEAPHPPRPLGPPLPDWLRAAFQTR